MQTNGSRVAPEFWALCLVIAAVFCALLWANQKTQQLRRECEARGGVLVRTTGDLICISKGAVLKIPRASSQDVDQ